MSVDPNANQESVHTVSVKIPQFPPQNPAWFFMFCESQFRLKGITADETRYEYVACNLSPEVAARVMTVLSSPPAEGKYEALKAKLLKEYTLTNQERAAALLDLPGLGDQKPSQLLSRMLELFPAGDSHTTSCFLFREIFLRQLPADLRLHLADKSGMSLESLAEEADKFFTSAGQRVSAVQQPARTRKPPSSGLCFFHQRFGDQARRCRPPCSYRPGN